MLSHVTIGILVTKKLHIYLGMVRKTRTMCEVHIVASSFSWLLIVQYVKAPDDILSTGHLR